MAAASIGLASLMVPGRVAAAADLVIEPGTLWSLRLLGVRDLSLAALLWRAAAQPEAVGAGMRRVVIACQVGDVAVTGVMARRGQVGTRLLWMVSGGALLTALVSGWPGRRPRKVIRPRR